MPFFIFLRTTSTSSTRERIIEVRGDWGVSSQVFKLFLDGYGEVFVEFEFERSTTWAAANLESMAGFVAISSLPATSFLHAFPLNCLKARLDIVLTHFCFLASSRLGSRSFATSESWFNLSSSKSLSLSSLHQGMNCFRKHLGMEFFGDEIKSNKTVVDRRCLKCKCFLISLIKIPS